MKPAKFRVYYEYEIDGEIHKGIESESSWFLLTQSGELLQHGPLEPLRDCKEYKKLIPLFYTGLKDSKGVEIYEGDIVRFWIDNIEEVSEVFFECGCFSVKTKNTDPYYHPCLGVVEFVEIIGNIYEQPELLPGKE